MTDVVAEEAARAGLTAQQLRGPKRYKHYAEARRQVAHRLREMGRSFASIGRALGGRHYTTAMAYFWTAEKRIDRTAQVAMAEERKEQSA